MQTLNTQRKAYLDMLAWSEIGDKLLKSSDNGYNVIVGGTLFNSYVDHPRKLVSGREHHQLAHEAH